MSDNVAAGIYLDQARSNPRNTAGPPESFGAFVPRTTGPDALWLPAATMGQLIQAEVAIHPPQRCHLLRELSG